MELDMSLLWVYLSIVVPIIASIVVASIAVANHLGKRIDAVNSRIDDLRGEMVREIGALRGDMVREFGALRSEMVREFDALRSEMVREFGALRSEMNRGFDGLNKRIDDLRTDLGKWTEITEADIRELRAPIFAQASGKAAPDGSNFRK